MKRLLIDLEACRRCKECTISCSYPYHPENDGIANLRELATMALICRHCEEGACIQACPMGALERLEDGTVRRANMLCSRCTSCSYACPFGTLYPEITPFFLSACDLCTGRLAGDEVPLCVETCPEEGALLWGEFEEDEAKGVFSAGAILVKTVPFWREEKLGV